MANQLANLSVTTGMNRRYPFSFIPLALVFSIAANAQVPQSFKADYTVSTEQYEVGKATLTLEQRDQQLHMALVTKPTGLFSLMSRGNAKETSTIALQKTDDGQIALATRRYTTFQKKAKPGRNLEAEFVRTANLISVLADGKDETVVKTNGVVYDPLSSMAVTMQYLLNEPPATLTLSIFNRGVVKESHFEFIAAEPVETQTGNYDAVRVTRKHGSSERETHVWYAESLGYAPVKIEQYKRGELVARLVLKSIER